MAELIVDELCNRWGRAPRDRLSGVGLKPPPSCCGQKPSVVSVGGKARGKLVQVRIRETNESEPFEDASLRNQVSSKPDA